MFSQRSPGASAPAPTPRPTVRVLLLDEENRLLLLRMQALDGTGPLWFTVGGGIDPGETAQDAARREVREETGLTRLDLGPELWQDRRLLTIAGVRYDVQERYFLARVRGFTPDTSGFTAFERASIEALRWWTPAQLRDTPERLVPRDLGERLGRVLEGLPAAGT